MITRVTTPPASEPVSIADALRHCEIIDPAKNEYISGLITKARDWIERTQNRALFTQTVTGYLDSFPEDRTIKLERAPLVSVTSINYVDENGTTQAFTGFHVDAVSEPGRIVLNKNESWPSTDDVANAVTIVYQAGYTAQTFPPAYKHALLMLVSHWNEHREPAMVGTTTSPIPLTLQSLLDSVAWDVYR